MVILAPMAGVTSLSFRVIARELGCDMVVSEMVSAKGLLYNNERTWDLLKVSPQERPIALQLFGSEPEVLAEAASLVVAAKQPEMLDLNMGCPTPKIVKNGDGSALLRNPLLARDCARAVVEAVKIPVTVKIRIGWDDSQINAVEIAQLMEAAGVHWIAVHARTRDQFYQGRARWEWIRRVKDEVSIPVVGNGDIFSAYDALAMYEQTGCDHIMVGRGAMGNPWLFREIESYLTTGNIPSPPTNRERIEMALRQLSFDVEHKGEMVAVKEMRPQLSWYLKGVPNSSKVRGALNQADSFQQVEELLLSLL